jgi:pyruvate,water dikinase
MTETVTTKLNLGASLHNAQVGAKHILLSIGDVIQERLFFHPALISSDISLSDTDKQALDAVLSGQEATAYYKEVLNHVAKELSLENYQSVRVQLSHYDSAALSTLIGGAVETPEQNPQLGTKGISRYASVAFKPSFALECEFIKSLREQGINVEIVVPFVRSLSDAAKVIDSLAEQGLPRGLNGLKVLFSADTPSAALLTERLLNYFDGVAVDLSCLAQLTLGIDRNNEAVSAGYNPENQAVLELLGRVLNHAQSANKPSLVIVERLADYSKLQDLLLEYPTCDLIDIE